MSKITVKFDNALTQSKIIVPINAPAHDQLESGSSTAMRGQDTATTMLYGIAFPLIKIGDIVVDYPDILYMSLDLTQFTPSLVLKIQDPKGLIKGLQSPGVETEVRVQLIPRFDNVYKKIDLTFYPENIEPASEGLHGMTLFCKYKVNKLYGSIFKCFGEKTTYEVFEEIAQDLQLGFASNVEASNDVRYIYSSNQSYQDFLQKILEMSGDNENNIGSKILYDAWIDPWNNLNFADIYERFLSVDPEEEMMTYIDSAVGDYSQLSTNEQDFIYTIAQVSNGPQYSGTAFYTPKFDHEIKSTKLEEGSDRVYSTYSINEKEAIDYLVQDGDQKKDIFIHYNYLGECYRDFDYLMAKVCRKMMMDKMNEEVVTVTLDMLTFGIMRGSKINLKWYDSDSELNLKKQDMGINEEDMPTDMPIPEDNDAGDHSDILPGFRVNKQITGQYYVLGSIIEYDNKKWKNTLKLTKPRERKYAYIDLSDAEKQL